jgi:hypothetical protein
MQYRDLTLEAFDYRAIAGGPLASFKLRVVSSPAGEMSLDTAVTVQFDQQALNVKLEWLLKGPQSTHELAPFGAELANLLLPVQAPSPSASVRDFLRASLDLLHEEEGLRLRLRLPTELAILPWEYLYVERQGGGLDCFLVLDPRISIVRHEQIFAPLRPVTAEGDIRLLAALAAPSYLDPFDQELEQRSLENALRGQPGLQTRFVQNATLADLAGSLPEADVFHFIGHGKFTRRRDGAAGYTGAIAFNDRIVDASELVIYLRRARLAILGGCETARRDAADANSGIVSTLARAGVPCALGNQFLVQVKTASAFNAAFYRALVGGLSIEQAVSAGRIAAFAADPGGGDWGAPALYLRGEDSQLFAGASDPGVRQAARQGAEANIQLHAKQVARGGKLLGAQVDEMHGGRLNVQVSVDGVVAGTVTGAQIGTLDGGQAAVKTDVDTVGDGGDVTGVKIGRLRD